LCSLVLGPVTLTSWMVMDALTRHRVENYHGDE
jgi:hypothetical protein